MKRRSFLRSSAAFVGLGILGSGDSHTDQIYPNHVHAASLVTECAKRFLAALDADQHGKVTFPFDTDERMNWPWDVYLENKLAAEREVNAELAATAAEKKPHGGTVLRQGKRQQEEDYALPKTTEEARQWILQKYMRIFVLRRI